MKKGILFMVVAFLWAVQLNAQKSELGSVTKEELLQKRHATDTSAVAAILFKKAKTKFTYSDSGGFVMNTEFSVKIKIYKKEGLNWANFKIPFYVGYEKLDDDAVEISKAFTYNLENGSIQKTRVDGGGKFVDRVNEFWKTKMVTFPNVKEGSIIELKYVMKSSDLSELPEFKFQYDIPVDYAEYITEIPAYYVYQAISYGKLKIDMKEDVSFATRDFKVKAGLSYLIESVEYKQVVTKYSLTNINALAEEDYVNNMENYYGKLEHELQIIKLPNEEPKKISSDWESVAKTIYKDERFGKELSKNFYLTSDLGRIINQTDTDQQKIDKIFNFIKTKMTWNGKYGYFTRKPLETVYAEQSGNVAEINLILTAMLRLAGFNSYPVLISSRENGLVTFPNRTKYNYVLSSVTSGTTTLLLDATSKNATSGLLPIRDLNWYGRMIKGDGSSSEIELMPSFLSNKTTIILASITSDGKVEGKVREQHNDYKAVEFREKYGRIAEESYLEMLEKKYNNTELSGYSVTGVEGDEKVITENYSFINNNSIESIGDKLFFSPLLFLAPTENPFKSDSREYPVDFIFPQGNEYKVSLTIPSGYVVESVPKSATIAMKGNMVIMDYSIVPLEGKIQLSMKFNVNTAILMPEKYNELKAVFNTIILKQNEKIVLKKV